MSETISDSLINTNNIVANATTVDTSMKKPKVKKVKELTTEQIEAKKKADEEKATKKAAKEKEREHKKAEREKEAEKIKNEKIAEKKKKATLALQEALDKTHGFKVPSSNAIFSKGNKRKLGFMTYIYEIMNELAPELLKDLSVRIAYNYFIEVLIKHSDYIHTYRISDNTKYDWFSKKHSNITSTDIEKSFAYSYYFVPFSGYYYIPTGKSLVKGTEEYKIHSNNIKEVNDTYMILYNMIYPVISPKAFEKITQIENARIVAENKARIKWYKDNIIESRKNTTIWKNALKKLDVEGTTYNELFGEGIIEV